MTDKQLTKLGIHNVSTVFKKNTYFCETTDSEMKISRDESIKSILSRIYEEGIENGIKVGKAKRSKEFKELINDDGFNM